MSGGRGVCIPFHFNFHLWSEKCMGRAVGRVFDSYEELSVCVCVCAVCVVCCVCVVTHTHTQPRTATHTATHSHTQPQTHSHTQPHTANFLADQDPSVTLEKMLRMCMCVSAFVVRLCIQRIFRFHASVLYSFHCSVCFLLILINLY